MPEASGDRRLRSAIENALEDAGVRLNRRGLIAFHERDHGPRDGSSLSAWIAAILAR